MWFWQHFFGKKPQPATLVSAFDPAALAERQRPCCCGRCGETDLGAGGACPKCCKCNPNSFCLTFRPDDSLSDTTRGISIHQGGGVYNGGDLGVTITLNFQYCLWEIVSETLGIDESFDVSEVGCREPTFSTIAGALGGAPGELTVEIQQFFVSPIIRDESGCWGPICDCDCICGRLCVTRQIGSGEDVTVIGGEIFVWDDELVGWRGEDSGDEIILSLDKYGNCIVLFGEETAEFTCPGSFEITLPPCDPFDAEETHTLSASCAGCDPCPAGCICPSPLWFHDSISGVTRQSAGFDAGGGCIEYNYEIQDSESQAITFECDPPLEGIFANATVRWFCCGSPECYRGGILIATNEDCFYFLYDLEYALVSVCPFEVVVTQTNPVQVVEDPPNCPFVCDDDLINKIPQTIILTITDYDPDA